MITCCASDNALQERKIDLKQTANLLTDDIQKKVVKLKLDHKSEKQVQISHSGMQQQLPVNYEMQVVVK